MPIVLGDCKEYGDNFDARVMNRMENALDGDPAPPQEESQYVRALQLAPRSRKCPLLRSGGRKLSPRMKGCHWHARRRRRRINEVLQKPQWRSKVIKLLRQSQTTVAPSPALSWALRFCFHAQRKLRTCKIHSKPIPSVQIQFQEK